MSLLVTVFFVLWATGALATLLSTGMFAWVMGNFLLCGLVAVLFMVMIFFIARKIGRYDLVDAAWGGAFIVVALTSFILGGINDAGIDAIVTALVIIWGSRLSYHILRRIKNSDTEDPRYVELRKKWKGNLELNIFFRIYMLQAMLVLFISVPVIHINLFNPGTRDWVAVANWFGFYGLAAALNLITIVMLLGLVVWLAGFVIESVADRQLRLFVSNPKNKGKLMTLGLWRYSRHPNYFGELTQWWGIFIICLTTYYGLVGIIGPVLISYLILYVSGIPLNEKRFEGRPGWKDYKARTSALIPLPPRG